MAEMHNLNVVFCAAEMVPYAKVGGLGDVMGSLPPALAKQGVNVTVMMPRYGCIETDELTDTGIHFDIQHHGQTYPMIVWKGTLPGSLVPVYFLDNPELYSNRKEVYPPGRFDLEINGFLAFSKAVFELFKQLKLYPDILHLHDWHMAPTVVELVKQRQQNPEFAQTRSILTIHNLAYQGVYEGTNWLREGLLNADFLTTVSPTYAQEIQTPEFGEGLHDVMIQRRDRLMGILNGIDTELFNPATDAFIPTQYDSNTVKTGKARCKADLQKEFGLPEKADVPVFGMVSRLVEQKGLDILIPVMETLAEWPIQWVILGTGEPKYEEALKRFNEQYPNMRSYIGFNLAMAQRIYAGSDVFLMPSRFEPCGLGQLIAMRYGTAPLARAVGGLNDTVLDVRKRPNEGTGFLFSEYTEQALADTVQSTLAYYQNPQHWATLVAQGMAQNFGWERSAREYQSLYQRIQVEQPVGTSS